MRDSLSRLGACVIGVFHVAMPILCCMSHVQEWHILLRIMFTMITFAEVPINIFIIETLMEEEE